MVSISTRCSYGTVLKFYFYYYCSFYSWILCLFYSYSFRNIVTVPTSKHPLISGAVQGGERVDNQVTIKIRVRICDVMAKESATKPNAENKGNWGQKLHRLSLIKDFLPLLFQISPLYNKTSWLNTLDLILRGFTLMA